MNDPVFHPTHYLMADDLISHIIGNMEIQFQIEGLTWDRDTMQEHVDIRAALLRTKLLLLDEAKRLFDAMPDRPTD